MTTQFSLVLCFVLKKIIFVKLVGLVSNICDVSRQKEKIK